MSQVKRYESLELDQQLCFALYSASRAMTRAYAPLLEQVGLTYPQYVTMLALWDEPHDAVTVSELGARLHLDSGTLTPLLKRLERLGHVRRHRDTADERRVLVELTEQGLALRDALVGVPKAMLARSGLQAGDGGRLRDELVELAQRLEQATG